MPVSGPTPPDPSMPDRLPEHGRLEGTVAERVGSVREARWIVEHAGGDAGLALALAERRATGEPLQYVLGRWPFRSLELVVDRRVLIPRPETEQVVGEALTELATLAPLEGGSCGPARSGPVAVDLGTGSGAIALSLAVEGGAILPDLVVWATDLSADALAVAADNLERLGQREPTAASRVHLSEGRWFEALPPGLAGSVDLVVSNPPYVAEADFPDLDPTVRSWEPRQALLAPDSKGVGGLADIETVITGAAQWLRPGGVVVVEIDPAQAGPSLGAARRAGFICGRTERDLAGRERMVVARR